MEKKSGRLLGGGAAQPVAILARGWIDLASVPPGMRKLKCPVLLFLWKDSQSA